MPRLVPILTNNDIDNYTPPDGYTVSFLQNTSKGFAFYVKLPDGTIQEIGVTQNQTSFNEITEKAIISNMTIFDKSPEVAIISGDIENNSETLKIY